MGGGRPWLAGRPPSGGAAPSRSPQSWRERPARRSLGRYPTDAGLAGDAVRWLAREGKRAAALVVGGAARVRDRSRAVARRLPALNVALRRRSGDAKDEVHRLTGECGKLADAAVRDARTLGRG